MSAQPTVCAICLTKDRPEMLARAVRSFQAQTYENKRLIIYDSSANRSGALNDVSGGVVHIYTRGAERSIGRLRNDANGYSDSGILVHFDDDDVSHPNRIAEQVALLQGSGADVVGYSNLLFWAEIIRREAIDITRSGIFDRPGDPPPPPWREFIPGPIQRTGEAWLYTARDSGFSPGTSLAYWRKTWEAKPFPDISQGEDNEWLRWLKLERDNSLYGWDEATLAEPRLVASIHAGNTSDSYRTLLAVNCEQRDHYFRRVPEYDAVCREAMAH